MVRKIVQKDVNLYKFLFTNRIYLVFNIFLGCGRANVAIVDFGGESQGV